jgi:TRAP-type mannitol/chloroaromatic compound transport system permease small subunit
MQKLDHRMGSVTNVLLLLSGILVMLMAWLQTYGVVKRYAFHAPDPLAYEFSTMFMLFCGVLAVAGVEKLDMNVRNDIVASRFPKKLKLVLINTVFPVMGLVFVAVLIWKSMDNALYALQISQVSQSPWAIPLAPIKFVIPVGYILLAIVLIWKFFEGILLLRSFKETEETEKREQT